MARWRQVDRPDTIPGRSQRVFGDSQPKQSSFRCCRLRQPTTSRVTELDGQIDLGQQPAITVRPWYLPKINYAKMFLAAEAILSAFSPSGCNDRRMRNGQ